MQQLKQEPKSTGTEDVRVLLRAIAKSYQSDACRKFGTREGALHRDQQMAWIQTLAFADTMNLPVPQVHSLAD